MINQSKVVEEVSLCPSTWRLHLLSRSSKKERKEKEGKTLEKAKKRLITLASRLGIHGCGERREDFG